MLWNETIAVLLLHIACYRLVGNWTFCSRCRDLLEVQAQNPCGTNALRSHTPQNLCGTSPTRPTRFRCLCVSQEQLGLDAISDANNDYGIQTCMAFSNPGLSTLGLWKLNPSKLGLRLCATQGFWDWNAAGYLTYTGASGNRTWVCRVTVHHLNQLATLLLSMVIVMV